MDRHTGLWVEGWDWVISLVDDLFSTRVRERVQRRPYGSAIPDAIDRPINQALVLDVFVAAADAIAEWLSDVVELVNIALVEGGANGKTVISLEMRRLDTGETRTIEQDWPL